MNNLDIDIEGKHVVLAEKFLDVKYRDIVHRVVLARGGYGCSPRTIGTAVLCTHLSDGEEARWEGYQIERLATDEEVAAALAWASRPVSGPR